MEIKRSTARLLVLVVDFDSNSYDSAIVGIKTSDTDEWRKLEYDKVLQRYVGAGLSSGEIQLKVTGEKGWTDDERRIELHTGDNFVQSRLGPEDMPYYLAAGGAKAFFKPDPSKIILYVGGKDHEKRVHAILSKNDIKIGEQILSPGQDPERDIPAYPILLPKSQEDKAEKIMQLEKLIQEEFPEAGLRGRLGLPMVRREKYIDGLTNELIVRFEPHVTIEEAERIAEEYSFDIIRPIKYLGNAFLFRSLKKLDYDIIRVAKELMEKQPVLSAEPNIIIQIETFVYDPNDFLYPEQPHFQVINADDAWDLLDDINPNIRAGSPDVTIAVFDPYGVDPNHPDLTGNLTDGSVKMAANFDFWNFVTQTSANLGGDHGTKCASSATARFDSITGATGLAGNCHLIGARLPSTVALLDLADGWIWAAGFPTGSTNPSFPAQLVQGADVISNSWGNPWAALHDTIKAALDFLTTYGRGGKGCIVCFAIGNGGYAQFAAYNSYAAYEKTIAVGSSINSNPTNPCTSVHPDPAGLTNNLPAVVDTRAYFSMYGPELDIVAPSHTSYDAVTHDKVDPIVSAVNVDDGDWTGNAAPITTTTQALAIGNTVIRVNNANGFLVGEYALVGVPGGVAREFTRVNNVNLLAGQLTVDALENANPIGTQVSTGPNDYARRFGGTSHSCSTVAGAAALILSSRPELAWIQVRDILRNTATKIDAAQANIIGQWVDNDGDGVPDFSQWYGHGRLDVEAAITEVTSPVWDLANLPDVVVRDNLDDDGSVPSDGWHANSPDIWVRRNDDPIPVLAYTDNPPHEHPVRGQDNFVYMRVKNVGTIATSDVYLRVLVTHYPGFEFRYPEEWQPSNRPGEPIPTPLIPGTYLIGEQRIDDLAPGNDIITKMTWRSDLIPPAQVNVNGVPTNWHPCLLAEVSPHDGPPAAGNTFDVKRDNNLAHKNISIEDPAAPGADQVVTIVVGTNDLYEVTAVVIDPSRLPQDYRVFARIGSKRLMQQWLKLLEVGKIKSAEPIPSADHIIEDIKRRGCQVTLLDSARLNVDCCDGSSVLIRAPRKTQVELLCKTQGIGLPEPVVERGNYKDTTVLLFRGGTKAIEIPLGIPSGQFLPVIIGVIRPSREEEPVVLRATQKKSNGELSPGYSIQC
ncbi:MAG: S8 family serine peptidase [Candidatus Thorarchaeota archaeon]|jgi:hypothetical protein